MTTIQKWTFLYGAVVHATALLGMIIVIALGRASWTDLGPFISGLVGLGIGVPLVINGTQTIQQPPQQP